MPATRTPRTEQTRRPPSGAAWTLVLVGFALAALGLVWAPAAQADDRDLLRDSSGKPYVFILFDTSGSMNETPKCTQDQYDAGTCDVVCPTGDCFVPLKGDDPQSKFYQAKEALYQVIQNVNDVDFGFATFNQDSLRADHKHFIYQATSDGWTFGGDTFPAAGEQEVFGHQFPCDTFDDNDINNGREDHEIGCYPGSGRAADLDDEWERGRVARLAKGGDDFDQDRLFFTESGGDEYALYYRPVTSSGPLGSPTVQMLIYAYRCRGTRNNGEQCNNYDYQGVKTITYEYVDEFFFYEPGSTPNRDQYANRSFFTQGSASDVFASNSCSGWDGNYDSNSDDYNNINLKYPTIQDPDHDPLDIGDMLPLSWETGNQDEVLQRLAPNIALGETVPDFSQARYFENRPGNRGVLELKDSRARPILPFGSTPLGASIRDFRTWYAGCAQGNCPRDDGWKDLAEAMDPDWGCRRTYLLVISDGDASGCDRPDACSGTAGLRAQEGVKTYVVAFGVQNTSGNRLNCMAANGGTGDPIYPQNQQELVEALTRIFGEIQEEARSFASAAVPSVQASVDDKIFLSSFTPLNDESVWDGHLDAFVKPLPLVVAGPDAGRPDRDIVCNGSRTTGCRAWDAGEELLAQTQGVDLTVDPPEYGLGTAQDERRVFYGSDLSGDPVRDRHLFEPPPELPNPLSINLGSPEARQWRDLLFALGISYNPLNASSIEQAMDRARDVIGFTLAPKQAEIEDPDDPSADPQIIDYIMGDVFHSNPVIVGNPDNLVYFSQDIDGYQDFALRHRVRRKVVMVGTNDGQLHAFDAGTYSSVIEDDDDLVCPEAQDDNRTPQVIASEVFTNGTGREIYSFIPRAVMPTLTTVAEGNSHRYSVDSTVSIGDANIGPTETFVREDGTSYDNGWRSLAVSGLRRGGRSVYALDITQPDRITERLICELDGVEEPTSTAVTGGDGFVPSCLGGLSDGSTPTNCGPAAYPAVRWEFFDTWDENLDGFADLGDTWSKPVIARIRVCTGGDCDPASATNDIEDRYVAIFGGGFDETAPFAGPGSGGYLYMVDMNDGEILYKEELLTPLGMSAGMAPSEAAALDQDLDGYLDTVYIGTTGGYMFKVDMTTIPELSSVRVSAGSGLPLQTVTRIDEPDWEPLAIFDTGGRPMFFPPSVIYIAQEGRFALAFGTGDRDNLWSNDPLNGRFYTFLDNGIDADNLSTPLTESDLTEIDLLAANLDFSTNLLDAAPTDLTAGWFMAFEPGERMITRPFALSGILFFTAYSPQVIQSGGGNGNGNGNGNGGNADPETCARTGESRIFTVFAANANALVSVEGALSRFQQVPEFVTDPFTELSTTKNESPYDPLDPDGGTPDNDYTDDICNEMADLGESLKDLFPRACRFGNTKLNIQTVRSDRGLVCISPVPICTIESNWGDI